MSKITLLRWVNVCLIFSFLVQAVTSSIIFFKIKLPNVTAVFELHEYNGLLMITLVTAHIILNWGWIRANFLKKK